MYNQISPYTTFSKTPILAFFKFTPPLLLWPGRSPRSCSANLTPVHLPTARLCPAHGAEFKQLPVVGRAVNFGNFWFYGKVGAYVGDTAPPPRFSRPQIAPSVGAPVTTTPAPVPPERIPWAYFSPCSTASPHFSTTLSSFPVDPKYLLKKAEKAY